jgi:hypothetical protein
MAGRMQLAVREVDIPLLSPFDYWVNLLPFYSKMKL